MNSQEKQKNLKDLEYSHILNTKNVILGVIGAAVVSVLLVEEVPKIGNLSRGDLVLFLMGIGFFLSFYYGDKLNAILHDIKKI